MKLLKNIANNNIWLKISFFNAFSVVTRILSGWVINKIIALYVGPQGTGLTEQLRNLYQTAQGFATLGISDGVTKYTAKYQNNKKQLSSFLASAYKIVLITSVIVSFLIITFSKQINMHLFGTQDFKIIILLTGILIPVFAINIILMAILNGFQKYKKITYIKITGNIISALLAVYLIYNYQLFGAMLLILAAQIASFIITLIYIQSDMMEILQFSFNNTHKSNYKRLYKYILMAMATALTVPVFSILIRNQIYDFYPDDQGIHAGYWDGVKKISTLFITFITPVFTLYYYPQLAKIQTNKDFLQELKKFYKQIFPLFFVGIVLLYLFRNQATLLFFSKDYLPMNKLYIWQLSGDLIRVISLTIAYLMLARAHTAKYIATEIGFWIVFYFLTRYFIQKYEVEGVAIAYFVTYILYFFSLIILYWKVLFGKKKLL